MDGYSFGLGFFLESLEHCQFESASVDLYYTIWWAWVFMDGEHALETSVLGRIGAF